MAYFYAAAVFIAVFALATVCVIREMIKGLQEQLHCGECGRFTEDLTDDDVCRPCASALSGRDPK